VGGGEGWVGWVQGWVGGLPVTSLAGRFPGQARAWAGLSSMQGRASAEAGLGQRAQRCQVCLAVPCAGPAACGWLRCGWPPLVAGPRASVGCAAPCSLPLNPPNSSTPLPAEDWDVVLLGHYCHSCPLLPGNPRYRHALSFFGTHAYVVHRRGLQKIFAYPRLMPIEKQIDAGVRGFKAAWAAACAICVGLDTAWAAACAGCAGLETAWASACAGCAGLDTAWGAACAGCVGSRAGAGGPCA
jgi:hypothetical protein